MERSNVVVTAAIAVALAMAVLEPIAVLWALNLLFDLGLPYTFATWLAAFVVLAVLRSAFGRSK